MAAEAMTLASEVSVEMMRQVPRLSIVVGRPGFIMLLKMVVVADGSVNVTVCGFVVTSRLPTARPAGLTNCTRRSTRDASTGPDTVAQTVLPELKDDAPVVQLDAKVETESANGTCRSRAASSATPMPAVFSRGWVSGIEAGAVCAFAMACGCAPSAFLARPGDVADEVV